MFFSIGSQNLIIIKVIILNIIIQNHLLFILVHFWVAPVVAMDSFTDKIDPPTQYDLYWLSWRTWHKNTWSGCHLSNPCLVEFWKVEKENTPWGYFIMNWFLVSHHFNILQVHLRSRAYGWCVPCLMYNVWCIIPGWPTVRNAQHIYVGAGLFWKVP